MSIHMISLLTAVFLFSMTLVIAVWLLVDESSFLKRRKVKKRLLYMTSGSWHGQEKIILYRDKLLADASFLVRLSFALPRSQNLDRMLISAGFSFNSFYFILGSLAFLPLGWLAGIFFKSTILAIFLAGVACFIPYLALVMRIKRMQEKFIEQFPEALDLIARALRAGNAMTSGLLMVSEEMDSPIKDELRAVVDEINFGLSFKDALMNLGERMPLTDVKFFVAATLIQRETGGNISDVMNNISHIIRSRAQFQRHVKTLTAEGRMSAIILLCLPVAAFCYLYMVNFDYISLLWREKMGQYMSIGCVLLMLGGTYVINKMVKIEA